MPRTSALAATAAALLAAALLADGAPAQDAGQAAAPEPLTETTRTARSHTIAAGAAAGVLEGEACSGDFRMIGGACHPGFSDQVIIINQFPNVTANTWRCGFKNNTSSQRTVWVYTVCGRDTGPPLVTHNLTVRSHTSTTLTNADADRIMADANTVIQEIDGDGDVACGMAMVRSGNVETFAVGTGNINSSADFSGVIQAPGWVKVVNQINWCASLSPGIIGCAPVPGTSFAVVRFTEALEGILWLHEFGHNKGLSHRNDANAVMAPSIGATRRRVNQAECNAFLAQPALAEAPVMILAAEGQEMPEDVRDFVRQIFFHGVPFEEARRYGPEDVPVLAAMLEDPEEEPYWQTIVIVMGMIGAPEAAEPLIDFITEPADGELSMEHYRAKSNAVMSLGYLVNLGDSEEALDFLIEAAHPDFWTDENPGVAPFHEAEADRDADLAVQAILGLALAGTEEAIEALRDLRQDEQAIVALERASDADSLLDEAIREAERVRQQGLDAYYQHDD